jgi:hypothetical protein
MITPNQVFPARRRVGDSRQTSLRPRHAVPVFPDG